MVKGLDTFRNHFAGYEEQYVLIGGAACDIVFESNDATFRVTRELTLYLRRKCRNFIMKFLWCY